MARGDCMHGCSGLFSARFFLGAFLLPKSLPSRKIGSLNRQLVPDWPGIGPKDVIASRRCAAPGCPRPRLSPRRRRKASAASRPRAARLFGPSAGALGARAASRLSRVRSPREPGGARGELRRLSEHVVRRLLPREASTFRRYSGRLRTGKPRRRPGFAPTRPAKEERVSTLSESASRRTPSARAPR